ncbi:MAG: glycoside hydrolase family 3 N-terminal domain-containing protein [Bacteroidota bacterium]
MSTIESLLSRMTLAEKAGQMTQVTIDMISKGKPYKLDDPLTIDQDRLQDILAEKAVGSMLNVGTRAHSKERWKDIIAQVQTTAAQSRLGIPILYGIDTIHGANYIQDTHLFPQQLGLAAGANPELVEQLFTIAAEETLEVGIPWLFSPVADVGRHPAWPRLWEGFGEDPYLAGELVAAAVRGIEKTGAVSCLKHYLAYGAARSGKDRTPAYLHERQVRQTHLPPFVAGLRAGARTIMVNSAELNGIPLHADPFWLDRVLRQELGFEGVIVTDWEDIRYLFLFHKVAKDYREAVKMSILAGVDMSMTPLDIDFTDLLVDLVETGEISEARIDQSVRRILRLKEELGLFEQPIPRLQTEMIPSANRADLCQQAAEESVVLLRNENSTLPLSKDSRILVCGPAATTLRSLHGGWTYTWQGERTDELAPKDEPNLLEALVQEFGQGQVGHLPGCDFNDLLDLNGFEKAAAKSNAIVLALGEASYTEFLGNIDDLYLPAAQEQLALACLATGKPVILVLLGGRPRLISRFEEGISAVLTACYPGRAGGRALAGAISGRVQPSGKLPITYPRYPNALLTYDHKITENRELQGLAGEFNPQFEFGSGLTYTQAVQYKNLQVKLDDDSLDVQVSVELYNPNQQAVSHIVQLFLRDHVATVTPPNKRLVRFRRLSLKAGETQQVHFSLQQADFEFVGIDCIACFEEGAFSVLCENLEIDFYLNAAIRIG